MLHVEKIKERITLEVDGDTIFAITEVFDKLASGSDVVSCPGSLPPAIGDTHLNPAAAHSLKIECTGLDNVPDFCRECCKTLVLGIISVKGETIVAIPADLSVRTVVLPEDNLLWTVISAFFNPDFSLLIDFKELVAITSEEQMLFIKDSKKIICGREVDLDEQIAVLVFLN